MKIRTGWTIALAAASAAAVAAAVLIGATLASEPPPPPAIAVVPQPVEVAGVAGEDFTLDADTRIVVDAEAAEVEGTAEMLAALLRPASGFDLPVVTDDDARSGDIELVVADGEAPDGHGDEGYRLRAESAGIRIGADTAAGIWNGVQTSAAAPDDRVGTAAGGPARSRRGRDHRLPAVRLRSTMLDVARHFSRSRRWNGTSTRSRC